MIETRIRAVALFAATLLLPPLLQAQEDVGVQQLTPDTIRFEPYPPEEGAKIARLYGNPAEAGHYIVRFELAANWSGRPHQHGGAELFMVRSGTCFLAHGEDLSREAAVHFPPGSFVALPAGTPMRGFSGDDGCVVDVQGQGPFTTTYLDEEGEPGGQGR